MNSKQRVELLKRKGLEPGDNFPLYFGHHKFLALLLHGGCWVVLTGPDAYTFEDILHKGERIDPNDAKKIYPDLAGYGLAYRL
jgi:hypothetical protein